MNDLRRNYGDWVMVAGAAEGLGEAYSNALASKGFHVILVDHQAPLMHSVADRLEEKYGIRTHRLHLDLASSRSVDLIMEHIAQTNCRLIVYNAAYSRVRGFLDHEPTELERYIDVNARTPIRLIHAFVDHYKVQVGKRKGIILMSSLAGWWGTQLLAPYGATKAYNYILAESLHYELQPLNVDVMACIAGATSTPAYLATAPKYGRIRPHIMDPGAVAQGALRKLGRKAIYIPGMHNKFTFFLLSRIFPRSMAAGLMNRTIRQMYGEHSQGSQW